MEPITIVLIVMAMAIVFLLFRVEYVMERAEAHRLWVNQATEDWNENFQAMEMWKRMLMDDVILLENKVEELRLEHEALRAKSKRMRRHLGRERREVKEKLNRSNNNKKKEV